jgi:hypothetical protein
MSLQLSVNDREELRWMREHDGKREIEAVCDTFEGGLIGYLAWKVRTALGVDHEPDTGIGLEEVEDVVNDSGGVELNISDMSDIDGIWC